MRIKRQTEETRILIDFAMTWEDQVGREYYIDWGKEKKFATRLLAMDLDPDEYVARKKAFFEDGRWWEYGRWGFATFVNNINKCVPKPGIKRKRFRECEYCHEEMPENDYYTKHLTEGGCPKYRPASKETVHKAVEEIKRLADNMTTK